MSRATFMPYKAMDGYRWRLMAANGRVIADSGEAYTRMVDVKRAIRSVRLATAIARVR